MRSSIRFALSGSALLIIFLLVKKYVADIWDQYSVGSYIGSSWKSPFRGGKVDGLPGLMGEAGDKVVIMARLEMEDTSWVTTQLPEYDATRSAGEICSRFHVAGKRLSIPSTQPQMPLQASRLR